MNQIEDGHTVAKRGRETMYRILIAEDDSGIAEAICEQAHLWDMDTKIVTDFRHVDGEAEEYKPHLILLDIMLPFFDGYHWCAEIRKKSKVPIIFISSASENMNIVMAMNMGGDDFLVKPFDLSVLMAKILALLRRSYDLVLSDPIFEHRGVRLNTGDGSVTYEGQRIDLTKNEYRILLALIRSAGKVVSRERLMELLWETDSFVDENTLTVNVGRLRKKLDGFGLNGFVKTKTGVGYIVE